MSGCKFYNTIQYNTIQYNTSHYYNFWLFFHCKNKKLLWTFKRLSLRQLLLTIEEITL